MTSIVKPGRPVGNCNQLLLCNPILGCGDPIWHQLDDVRFTAIGGPGEALARCRLSAESVAKVFFASPITIFRAVGAAIEY
jgi:hypothetical protein